MKKSNDIFIEELANDLSPGRDWHPLTRTSLWAGLFFFISLIGMLAYQSFRPHFFNQILEYSRFSIELLSASVLCNLLIYFTFSFMVPGRSTPKPLLFFTAFTFAAWSASQFMAFNSASPPASPVGARSFCVEEVLFYGIVGILLLFYFVQKTNFPLKTWQHFIMGFVAGLVPGVLMQVACAYLPKHGLMFHYGPAVVTGLLATLTFPLLKRLKRS